jgi:hypothetical protein
MSEETKNTQETTTTKNLISTQDVFQQLLREETPEPTPATGNRINRNSPLHIEDHYRIGKEMFNHIDYMENLVKKERNLTENTILRRANSILQEMKRFLSERNFQKSKILNRYVSQLYHEFFELSGFNQELTPENFEHWHQMDICYKMIFITLISIFYYRKNLSYDTNIGQRIYDYYFFISVLHFSFEISTERYPTNQEILEVSASLSLLSSKGLNYNLENVNHQLDEIGSNIQFEYREGSSIRFYANRCPAMDRSKK